MEWLIQGGLLPVLLESLAKGTPDVQRLAASTLANVAISPQIRSASVLSPRKSGLGCLFELYRGGIGGRSYCKVLLNLNGTVCACNLRNCLICGISTMA